MDEYVYHYRIEGPSGERWRGTVLEGETVSFVPYYEVRPGQTFWMTFHKEIRAVSAGADHD